MESSASAGRVASAVRVRDDFFGMTFTDIAATFSRIDITRAPAKLATARPRSGQT